jgi:uncharacterized membrane protein YgcG
VAIPTNPTKLVTAAVAIPPPPPSHSEPSPTPSQLPTGVVPLACVPNIAAARAELPPSRGSDASAVSLREQRLQQRALERRRPSTSGSAGEGAGGGVFVGGGGRELWMPATAPVTPQLTQSSTPPTSSTPPGVVPGVSLPEEHRDWSAAEVEAYVLAQQMQRLHARAGEAQQALLLAKEAEARLERIVLRVCADDAKERTTEARRASASGRHCAGACGGGGKRTHRQHC